VAATSGALTTSIPFTVQNAGNTNPTPLPPPVTETQKPVDVTPADSGSTATSSAGKGTSTPTNTVSGNTKLTPPVNGTGIKNVQLVDPSTNQVLASGSSSATLNTTKLPDGVHKLSLVVTDKSGVQTTYPVTITVRNYGGFWQHIWYVITTPWRTLTEKLGL